MNVLYARNEFKGVMIACPHCHMNVRHDADDIGDAIKEGKQIVCVACGGRFVVSVTAVTENAVEPTLAPDAAYCGDCKRETASDEYGWCKECGRRR